METKKFTDEYMKMQEESQKENNMTIEKGTMYTINREMVVVETTEDFSNPLSYDKDALEMFLKNNRETLEDYFNDENNHGIAFHECGFSGKAQDEFIQSWMDSGIQVF